MAKLTEEQSRLADDHERRAVEKERRTIAEMAAFAAPLIFRVTMTDGRVFKKAGLHGSGGLFRLDQRSAQTKKVAEALLVKVHRMLKFKLEDTNHRSIVIYLAHYYCGSEILSVPPEHIKSIELEPTS